jgi:hypothetical protein
MQASAPVGRKLGEFGRAPVGVESHAGAGRIGAAQHDRARARAAVEADRGKRGRAPRVAAVADGGGKPGLDVGENRFGFDEWICGLHSRFLWLRTCARV